MKFQKKNKVAKTAPGKQVQQPALNKVKPASKKAEKVQAKKAEKAGPALNQKEKAAAALKEKEDNKEENKRKRAQEDKGTAKKKKKAPANAPHPPFNIDYAKTKALLLWHDGRHLYIYTIYSAYYTFMLVLYFKLPQP